jgi:hypothetical protein
MTDANTNVYASETAISTQVNEFESAYENADRYHDNMIVSELIGTSMHIPVIESEVEDNYTPMSVTEMRSLVGNDLFDWLA